MSSQRQGVHGHGLGAAPDGQLRMGNECCAPPATALAVLHQRERGAAFHARGSSCPQVWTGDRHTATPATHVTPVLSRRPQCGQQLQPSLSAQGTRVKNRKPKTRRVEDCSQRRCQHHHVQPGLDNAGESRYEDPRFEPQGINLSKPENRRRMGSTPVVDSLRKRKGRKDPRTSTRSRALCLDSVTSDGYTRSTIFLEQLLDTTMHTLTDSWRTEDEKTA